MPGKKASTTKKTMSSSSKSSRAVDAAKKPKRTAPKASKGKDKNVRLELDGSDSALHSALLAINKKQSKPLKSSVKKSGPSGADLAKSLESIGM